MLFIWLLYAAAMTFWTGMRPPRLSGQSADRLNKPGEAQRRAAAGRPAGTEPAEAASQAPATDRYGVLTDMPEALTFTGGRRAEGRADPETASLAANADS